MEKICFIGAPSTGKSTLAYVIEKKLKEAGYKIELVREYARDFIVEYGEIKKVEDQILIARGQKQREKEAIQKNPQFIICDCAVFLARVYASLFEPGLKNRKELLSYKNVLKEIDKEIKGEIRGYQHIFFCLRKFRQKKTGFAFIPTKFLKFQTK